MIDAAEGACAAQIEMPRYVSHKKVWALEIESVVIDQDAMCNRIVTFVDKAYAPKVFEPKMFLRYSAVKGDFFVVYADGYESFSPRKAFLEGYTRDA